LKICDSLKSANYRKVNSLLQYMVPRNVEWQLQYQKLSYQQDSIKTVYEK